MNGSSYHSNFTFAWKVSDVATGRVLYKKVSWKISENSQENTFCQSLCINKVADLRSRTLLKKWPWYRCFPVNFVKFLRTPTLQNTFGRLLLKFKRNNMFTYFFFRENVHIKTLPELFFQAKHNSHYIHLSNFLVQGIHQFLFSKLLLCFSVMMFRFDVWCFVSQWWCLGLMFGVLFLNDDV